jgi:hypothetical protein
MATAIGIGRPGGAVGRVGVPQDEAMPGSQQAFYGNVTVSGGPAPARAYIEELLPDVLEGRMEPGRVSLLAWFADSNETPTNMAGNLCPPGQPIAADDTRGSKSIQPHPLAVRRASLESISPCLDDRRDLTLRERGRSTVPEPIPPPLGYERLEGLPELVRRIVREELRPIHLLLEELRDRR